VREREGSFSGDRETKRPKLEEKVEENNDLSEIERKKEEEEEEKYDDESDLEGIEVEEVDITANDYIYAQY